MLRVMGFDPHGIAAWSLRCVVHPTAPSPSPRTSESEIQFFDTTTGPGYGDGMRKLRKRILAAVLATGLGVIFGAVAAEAQNCPGNPNALGTSRVLAIDPSKYPRVGTMQYPESLPLADKEVVITFDDGPVPRYSNPILDILASQCAKATYFLVGKMARTYPATVRRIYAEGHTIGTHSEDHPLRFDKLPVKKIRWEIDQGIADVGAALGDANKLAPFFRIPGLARSNAVENELAARSLVVFSSDTVADDWHHRITQSKIIALAMKRLEARGKGILLLHDIHPATVAALPGLLKDLKEQGFGIVQVVPASPGQF
jgi:peptidoglycan-N-acetylglucosamine deacetylase